MLPNKQKEQLGSKKPSQSYLKYSALAFQIVATILILVYAGDMLDTYMQNETPWFTLLGAVLGVMGSMIYLIMRVSKSK